MTESYNEDDLVYADPEKRVIVGRVEFTKTGNAKALEMPSMAPMDDGEPTEKEKGKGPRRFGKPRKRYYPWGSYKTMKKLYRIDGGVEEQERNIPLEDAIAKSMKEPFWD